MHALITLHNGKQHRLPQMGGSPKVTAEIKGPLLVVRDERWGVVEMFAVDTVRQALLVPDDAELADYPDWPRLYDVFAQVRRTPAVTCPAPLPRAMA